MRPTPRALQSLDGAFSPRVHSIYICPSCRQSHLPRVSARDQRRHASNKNLPFTEKLRRKIWGTDNPPGLKDPYGGPSFLERRRAEREGRILPEAGEADEDYGQVPPSNTPQAPPEEYVPATTWDGLEHIGGTGHWSETEPTSHDVYQSFEAIGGEEKLSKREELIKAIHQATVEITTHKRAGRPLENACATISLDNGILSIIKQTTISLSKDGTRASLRYPLPVSQAREAILGDVHVDVDSIDSAGERAVEEVEEEDHQGDDARLKEEPQSFSRVDSFADYPLPSDESFLDLPLKENLRFAFAKRLLQLTGHRLPDPMLTRCMTLAALLDSLLIIANPEPTKVADILSHREDLMELRNVVIKDRRQTWVDKERDRGLWKTIEKEIRARGLPMVGEARD